VSGFQKQDTAARRIWGWQSEQQEPTRVFGGTK